MEKVRKHGLCPLPNCIEWRRSMSHVTEYEWERYLPTLRTIRVPGHREVRTLAELPNGFRR